MTQTVSQALEKADRSREVAKMVTSYKPRFGLILPAHLGADTFTSLALGALRNPALADAAMSNPLSFIAALTNCARLGHQPNTEAFYLVPIKGKVEGWEGYRGIIERLYRSGAVASVHAQVVRQNDHYEYEEGMPHPVFRKPRPFAAEAERGQRVGAFAYARLRDGGTTRTVEMSAEDILRHRDANPFGKDKNSPWEKWPESMWLKCPTRELEKWAPSSIEYRQQVALSNAAAVEFAQTEQLPMPAEDVFDGEVLEAAQP